MTSLFSAPQTTRELVEAEQHSLARSLFTVAALRLSVVSLVLLGLVVRLTMRGTTEEDVASWHFILIGATYGLSVIYLALLRMPRLTVPLAYAQIFLDAALVTFLVFMTQGVESPFAFAYVFVVLSASLTLYRQGALMAAGTTVSLFGGILFVQLFGGIESLALPSERWSSAVFSYLGHSLGMVLVALLASTLAEKLRATGQKLAEKEQDLEELGKLHAAILRSLPAGVLTVDSVGLIRFANESALQILGLEERSLLARPLAAAVPSMAPAWRQLRESMFRDQARARFEADLARADGEMIRLGFSVAPLSFESDLSAIIVFQDVTDFMRLKDAVARSERLASVGQFAAGLAHEVRNPLASMCASIDVLRAALEPPESMQRLMGNITKEAERLNGLITDFLSLTRPRTLHAADERLDELVASVLDVFEPEVAERVVVVRRLVHTDVRIDRDLITQVLWNLLRNASEALGEKGGRIIVAVREELEGAFLSVRDDGPGIPEERLQKVFDPFFTTKDRGSGLGLAISNSIVEAHGGTMWVDTGEGKGTTVAIRFSAITSNLPLPTPEAVV